MPEAAGLLMLALKTWSPPPVSNTSPILNTNLLTHSVTLLLLLTPYLQSESAPAPLTAAHLLSIQLLIPGHRRLLRSTTSAEAGQAGTEPWSWWSAHVRQPVHSTHSSSSFSPFCQHTTCSLLPKTTFSAPRTASSSFSILFAFSDTWVLSRGSCNPQSQSFVQE